jgi:pilus assembly protein CpaC
MSKRFSNLKKFQTLAAALLLLSAICSAQQPAAATPSPTSASSEGQAEGPAPLRVMVGKSLLINTADRIIRVSVTDPDIADALVVTGTQIMIHGRAPGEVTLLIWDEAERSRSFDLRVDVDITAAAEEIKRIFPDEKIEVSASRSAIVLSGYVTTEDVAKHAGLVAAAYSKNVINVLTFGPVGSQEVLLEVKFAEVDRSAATELGANLFAPGLGNTIAVSQTGQFGNVSVVLWLLPTASPPSPARHARVRTRH